MSTDLGTRSALGKPEVLSKILQRAFPGIPDEEALEIIRSGDIRTYPADTVLCQENAIEEVFYIILEGEVKVTKAINQDEIRFLKNLHPGDFFGEMALIHNAPRAASVISTKPVTVLEINKESFDRMLHRSSSMALAMVREVSRRLRENDEMAIEDLRVKARELAAAYQKLAEEEFARREFLTTIAHELRTPLTAASGFLEMAKSGMLKGDVLQTALDTVSKNIQQIITLVNDILFLQEIDLILSEFQPVDIGEAVTQAVDKLRPKAQQNGVRLRISIDSNLPTIPGDLRMLTKAFEAVLDNAIKFSPDGGDVEVKAYCDEKQLIVEISDQGVGIPEEAKPQIFERFFHIDKIGDRVFDGIGLGLAIVKEVIDQHGGKILVESKLGEGTDIKLVFSRSL